ncbi:hypothetical protein [Selenomonas ruminantium]|uniref:Uncharacterized protein n=1 Tax=Selenomonas ruminantium TaxID=971 RepID=A0A1I0YBV8_SELRU|nr:hypothetical protein [Selenomonas ruminantium]SFB10277.1 hypothetical protein SAMN05216587_11152 [Selenomonas ruminantium]
MNNSELANYIMSCCGKAYKSPKKIIDANEKKYMEDLYKNSLHMIEVFNKEVENICANTDFVFVQHNNVLDGTRRRIRTYLWAELQNINYVGGAVSISLFAEPNNEKAEYRVALEINEKQTTYKMINKYNDITLTMDLPSGFQYGISKRRSTKVVPLRDKDELKNIISENKIYRTQIYKTIECDKVDNIEVVRKAINELKSLYDKVTLEMVRA